MKQIKLSQGKYTTVDDEDFEKLNQHKWYLHHNGYAARSARTEDGTKQTTILMHRVLMDATGKIQVDHINQNKLDNQKKNLRKVEQHQNLWNCGMRSSNTTGYKGVSIEKRTGKYVVYIDINKQRKYLGTFDNKEKAALAYNEAAKSRGDLTYLNPV